MNISIFVAGSSRRKVATFIQASRRTRAHSLPCCEPVSRISPPLNSASETIEDDLRHADASLCSLRCAGGSPWRDVVGDAQLVRLLRGLLVGDHDLVVALAALDPLLQHDEAVEDLFRPRRAARDVDVDRDRLIGARHGRVVLVEAAGRGADAERDHPLRLAHLLVDAPQGRALPFGDGADDDQQVSLAGREARELGAEARDVVLGRRHRHELHAAAGGDERVLEQRELARPVRRRLELGRREVEKAHVLLLPSHGALAPDISERDHEDAHEDQDLAQPEEGDAGACRRRASSAPEQDSSRYLSAHG